MEDVGHRATKAVVCECCLSSRSSEDGDVEDELADLDQGGETVALGHGVIGKSAVYTKAVNAGADLVLDQVTERLVVLLSEVGEGLSPIKISLDDIAVTIKADHCLVVGLD